MGRSVQAVRLLAELARTDLIRGVGCGRRVDALAEELGAPRDFGPVRQGRRWPHWFGYGNLQLEVCRCRLVTMLVVPAWQGRLEVPGHERGTVEAYATEGLGRAALAPALAASGYEPDTSVTLRGQLTLHRQTEEGVRTAFVFATTADGYEDGPLLDDPELAKIVSHAYHACPPVDPLARDDGWGRADDDTPPAPA